MAERFKARKVLPRPLGRAREGKPAEATPFGEPDSVGGPHKERFRRYPFGHVGACPATARDETKRFSGEENRFAAATKGRNVPEERITQPSQRPFLQGCSVV